MPRPPVIPTREKARKAPAVITNDAAEAAQAASLLE